MAAIPDSNSKDRVTSGKDDQLLVSVVLLSHDRPAFLRDALASLSNQSYRNLEIIVVDNPSSSSTEVAGIASQYPNILFIQNPENIGYTGGMNKGIEQAGGDYIFLTEDDVVLDRECVQQLVWYMEEHASADLLSPIIYNRTEETIRCAGGEFALGGIFRMKIYGSNECDTGQYSQPFDVNYLAGATLFARKSFWQTFKGFRQEFFMYSDDVELCARVTRAGKRLTVVPTAKVYHFEPLPQPGSPEIEFHRVKNFLSLYLLHARARHLPEAFCRYAILETVRVVFGRSEIEPRRFLQALLWVARQTPSLLRERYQQGASASSENSTPGPRFSRLKKTLGPVEPTHD